MSAHELDTLLKQLQSGMPEQRRMAALKLGTMQNPLIISELIAAADDSDDGVRSFIASALVGIGQPSVTHLQHALQDKSQYVRQMAVQALQHINTPEAQTALQAYQQQKGKK